MSEQPFESEEPAIIKIGDYLRQKREEKSYTLKAISQHTKITSRLLDRLERNHFEELPSKAYVTGFVKSYAKILDLNVDESLDILNQTYNTLAPPSTLNHSASISTVMRQKQPLMGADETTSDDSNKIIIPAFVIGATLVLVIVAMVSSRDKTAEEPKSVAVVEERVEPTPSTITPQKISQATPLKGNRSPENLENTETKDNAEELKVAAEKKAAAKKKAVVETNKKTTRAERVLAKKKAKRAEKAKLIDFKEIPQPMFAFTKDVDPKDFNQWLPKKYQNVLTIGKENVYIRATNGETWLTYKSDDKPIKKFVLRKGRSILIRGKDVRIFLGNANVTKIFYNNKLISPITTSGVKSLVFPEKLATTLKIPLFIYNDDGTVSASDQYTQ